VNGCTVAAMMPADSCAVMSLLRPAAHAPTMLDHTALCGRFRVPE